MKSKLNDRAAGALIGDALGVGSHWYYDIDEMHRDYGTWISDYTDPQPHPSLSRWLEGGSKKRKMPVP